MNNDARATQGDMHLQFQPVPSLTVEGLRFGVHAWATSAPMRGLVEEFGSPLPVGNLELILGFLDDFSRQHWNFRDQTAAAKGEPYVERQHVSWTALTPDREAIVLAAARALGLVDPRPPTFPQYDHMLILGGRARANRRRSMFAAHLARHVVLCRRVTGIGSLRELSQASRDNESTRLAEYDMPIRRNEAAMLRDAIQAAFLTSNSSSTVGRRETECEHITPSRTPDGISLMLLAAPNSPTGNRADTESSMTYWANHVANLRPGQRILNITTSIYAPYQQAVAIKTLALPFRVHVETIGVDDSVIGDSCEPPHFTAAQYLQEVRSTIRSCRSLITSIDQ